MNNNKTELNTKEMEQATGGTFTPNTYPKELYEAAGITVIKHWIDKDEFWWRGEDIGCENADAVAHYWSFYKRQPESLEEASKFKF